MKPLSLYIHWPFCAAKCPFCDFNSRATPKGLEEAEWLAAYLRELSYYAELLPEREIRTIYFGGGTPSLLSPSFVEALLQHVAGLWSMACDGEITLEANPASSDTAKFQGFKSAGVNRLSLGVQALNDADLRFLGRLHDVHAARQALESAAKTFDRFSFDLIYARKGQTVAAWTKELQQALSFGAQHLSLYQLTIEEGTVFHKRAAKQEVLTAGDDEAAALYELTGEMMAATGLPAYEISNYAAAGQESRHNLTYWHYEDYIGIGAGAHGRFVLPDGRRMATANHRTPAVWLGQVTAQQNGSKRLTSPLSSSRGAQRRGDPVPKLQAGGLDCFVGQGLLAMTGAGSSSTGWCETLEKLDQETAMREALMMGLRLTQGIDVGAWEAKFGAGSLGAFIGQEKAGWLRAEGLLATDNQVSSLRLTREGLQRLNAVLAYLVA
ncbi:MAG: radical SAM family heme chaperone HemW [Alphaproteobacteria bacterium]|nr:radical SAM family heme chaperone HemW [Alphaproteobacteria bacterium]